MANIANLLTEHMAIWTATETEKKSGRGRASGNAGSMYGVKKLRELILELAVRGKLVPQDANDEPASELLKRIQAEKAKLIAEGKLKKEKPLAPIGEDEKPFELPRTWEWARLSDLVNILNGRAYKKEELLSEGTPVLRVGNLFTSESWYYSNLELEETKYCNNGDLLFAWSASFGPFIWGGERSIYHYHIWKLDFYAADLLYKNFLYTFLLEQTQKIKSSGHGVMMIHMTKEAMEKLVVYLPPLAEQHRIVAKVDELMALCDQLEQQHSNAQGAHETLVSQLLATLTQSQNGTEFNANWQRIYTHFDVLFTTETSIDALKQTLLQLAVMGKLVPQDPNDEPASELLKRIQAEKAKLIAEGKLKKEKPLAPIIEEEKPFELPKGWQLTQLAEIIKSMDSGWSPACLENPSPSENVWGVLKTTAVQVMKYLEVENKELPEKLQPRPEAEAKAGDILFTRAGPKNRVGISCYIESTRKKLMISDKIIRFHPVLCDGRFITLSLNAGLAADYIEKSKSGMAESQVNVSQEKLKATPILLPPTTEQHRIVAKVDALMAMCDQLKTRIQQANQQQQFIADALVAQALKPATTEVIDLAAYRAAVTCNIIKRMQHNQAFGRTFAMKLLYLSQQHIGFETHLEFEREAAGPFDKWIYDFERDGVAAGWFGLEEKQLSKGYTKIEYHVKSAIDEPLVLMNSVGSREQRKELERLFALFADKKTEEAEIAATLFAAWNDFLLNGMSPTDQQILHEVRENWHPSKARFSTEQLTQWLSWLRNNNIVPKGKGSKTIYQKTLLH